MKTGKIIRELRKKKGWTQTELGEKLGLTFGGIASIEQGRCLPSAETTVKLSEIFNVTTDYILTGKEDSNSISKEEQEIIKTIRENELIKKSLIELINTEKKIIKTIRENESVKKALTELNNIEKKIINNINSLRG